MTARQRDTMQALVKPGGKGNVSRLRVSVPLCKLWLDLSLKVSDNCTLGSVTPRERETVQVLVKPEAKGP